MNALKDLLTAIWDSLFAPSCAFDPQSAGYCESMHDEDENEDEDDYSWTSQRGATRYNNDGTMFFDGYGVDVMGNAPGTAPLE